MVYGHSLEGVFGYVNLARSTCGLRSGRNVDCVAKETVARHHVTYDSSNYLAAVYPDGQLLHPKKNKKK